LHSSLPGRGLLGSRDCRPGVLPAWLSSSFIVSPMRWRFTSTSTTFTLTT